VIVPATEKYGDVLRLKLKIEVEVIFLIVPATEKYGGILRLKLKIEIRVIFDCAKIQRHVEI
jgi:hypothetical protein